LFYFIKDAEGNLQEFTVTANEAKDVGQLAGVMPKELFVEKEMITVEGRLLIEDGKPFAGGIVLAKSDMNSRRPTFCRRNCPGQVRYEQPAARFRLGAHRRRRPLPAETAGRG
jgi:cytochrome c-type biogenesis protein CcmE